MSPLGALSLSTGMQEVSPQSSALTGGFLLLLLLHQSKVDFFYPFINNIDNVDNVAFNRIGNALDMVLAAYLCAVMQ